jgi:8-oxo-dGTP diphosphatase
VAGVSLPSGLLARGPWPVTRVRSAWHPAEWEPGAATTQAADAALAALRDRGSPSHDGLAARLADYAVQEGDLRLELQPVRWALRLVHEPAVQSLSVLCAVRDAEGRWLAGRRAAWLASWAGRWALGAGGAVEVDEDPVSALVRELEEEWAVRPESFSVEALAKTPNGLVFLVGLARLPVGVEVTPDHEHDAYAWWPADVGAWPPEADEPLRRIGALLSS